ncbi:hypothetical protein A2392_01045 [Candidatus Kaiserbacteria bacterium RIFOXYB1_FULL_46_14]|uniref:Peptidase M50 domain-containing protein n=1 Tax=Candidatus Kaiserbacteria bacterium RIFOXYB1_FULL_46_14 TaxID=1798531 RepID=A0A1F6FJJ8_9BACT|nr:MAG: hypothetical protein A2392_01045 [Candidatus Kaiserbacteria bacterium RIFOXYB1_FULL_46_14]
MNATLFLAVLFVLILLHELGHFLTAKWTKMKVEEFAIGFPPRLFSWRRDETVFSFNILPIGGFVRILGENGEDEISAGDKARSFASRPRHHQAIVLVAGVVMNILTAWLIFYAVSIIGQPTIAAEGEPADLTVVGVLEGSPAEGAGIPLGAIVVSVGAGEETRKLYTPTELTEFVANHQEDEIALTYDYRNDTKTVALTPSNDVVASETDRAVIGLSTAPVKVVKEGPLEAVWSATQRTSDSFVAITIGIFTLLSSAFTFSADLSQVAGPIGIASLVGDAAEFGIVSLLVFTAMISLNLAVINLLPIPALDGGRLLFVIIEAILRRPLNPVWMSRANLLGFSLLIILMIAVTYNDIVKLI